MYYVYFISSQIKDFLYVGSTNDIKRRLTEHNEGLVQSTKHYKPFNLEGYIAVKSESHARELEKYFKTGSGRAILLKRLIQLEKNL
jgi:putative endonuclease